MVHQVSFGVRVVIRPAATQALPEPASPPICFDEMLIGFVDTGVYAVMPFTRAAEPPGVVLG